MPLEPIEIRDDESQTTAKILPGLGFNCYSLICAPAGKPIELLWSAPTFTSGMTRPAASGIPILFPFAGRIAGTSFEYEGKTYQLEVGDDLGNAIHGFVHRRPWRVVQQTDRFVSGEFQASIDDPALLTSWPADFRIGVDYIVHPRKLQAWAMVENVDTRPLPFGFGIHPYFRVPLSSRGRAEQCRIQVPVASDWELEGLRPTGRFSRSQAAQSLAAGVSFGETQFDNVFGGLFYRFDECAGRIQDQQENLEMVLRFGSEYRFCVVFNPPHREAICIEPYTTLPDPFTLHSHGIDPHQKVLAPGERWFTRIEVELLDMTQS